MYEYALEDGDYNTCIAYIENSILQNDKLDLEQSGIPLTEMRIEPFVARKEFRDGDIYLLCTDGLTDMLPVQQIDRILKSTSFDESAQCLLENVMVRGGRDNITIILCKIESE